MISWAFLHQHEEIGLASLRSIRIKYLWCDFCFSQKKKKKEKPLLFYRIAKKLQCSWFFFSFFFFKVQVPNYGKRESMKKAFHFFSLYVTFFQRNAFTQTWPKKFLRSFWWCSSGSRTFYLLEEAHFLKEWSPKNFIIPMKILIAI